MMDFLTRIRKQFSWQLVALSLCLLMVPLIMNSCGTSNYNTPITSQTSATLLSPETLKTWIDSGVVNSTGYDKVIILDVVSSLATYTAGHIPAAQFLNQSDLFQVRQEGPAADFNMVIDGPRMDALVQKYGIDKNTTIVFTGSASSVLYIARAYWTFRYWGFPKEKLKFLDGIDVTWKELYGLTAGNPPTPAPSAYSVKNNLQLRTDLRASLGDMINVAEGKVANGVPVDMRTSETTGSYVGMRGSTTGGFNPGSDYMVFEGRVKGARALDYNNLLMTSSTVTADKYRFQSADVLAGMFNQIGIDSTKLAHVY